MPINIDYSPVGALGSLAATAGQGQGQREAFAQDMQLQDLALRQNELQMRRDASDKAFQLQTAMASRQAMVGQRTPVADHVAEHLQLENKNRQDEQAQTKGQLDTMLNKGQITQTQYQQAMTGVLSGSKGLVDRAIIPTTQTDPLQRPQFQAQVQMLRDKRASLYSEKKEIDAALLDPFKAGNVQAGRGAAIDAELKQNYADEAALMSNAAKSAPPSAIPQGTPSITSGGQTTTMTAPTPTFQEGHIKVNPLTGEAIIFQKGNWVPYGTPKAGPSAVPAPLYDQNADVMKRQADWTAPRSSY